MPHGRYDNHGEITERSRRLAKIIWLFDLDNTLHDASAHIFPQLGSAMKAYMCEHLNLDDASATQLRQHYWSRYGATLIGLMRHHDIDPDHFLRQTHHFPELDRMVVAPPALKAMLKRLPGRKILFSNAPRHYIDAILDILGIRRCFSAIYSIERLRYRPKPARSGFLHLLRREKLDPRQCIMVEDSRENLRTARKLRMKTVWVSTSTRHNPDADVQIRSVALLPERLGQL
ncbi:pyrimidine 5'-nucleotidase [uncultured Propionivibrio sp.]|uniref:pyrimidine 5'-nucleotidase n=1 Tax=uncultured Propionivibrio sp. TaxID=426737 RepID=UPI0029C09AB4|nr:pyrimidine 5'-nucleotidase [uncultured Propionivibrio sp.]